MRTVVVAPPHVVGQNNNNCKFQRLTFEKLQDVFDYTSRNFQPILELRLLFESNVALLNGDYRRSVLDSATSLEVMLSRLLKVHLNCDEPLLTEILRKYNSIAQRLQLLRTIGLKLMDTNSYREVETLRNYAIHAGREPTNEQAREAFKTVKQFVNNMNKEYFEPTQPQ